MAKSRATVVVENNGLLFSSLAEQVKLPFVQIAHAAELHKLQPSKQNLSELHKTIAVTSAAALQLIDGYLLHIRLQQQAELRLEPVSISSLLYDTAQKLDAFAKAHDCVLQLDVKGKYGPVMGRHDVLKTALESLGYAFVEALSGQNDKKPVLKLIARRSKQGLATGIYSELDSLSAKLFRQAKFLKGIARQPLNEFTPGSGAGVFVADALLSRLDCTMKVSKYQGFNGLSVTLAPSHQLSLV